MTDAATFHYINFDVQPRRSYAVSSFARSIPGFRAICRNDREIGSIEYVDGAPAYVIHKATKQQHECNDLADAIALLGTAEIAVEYHAEQPQAIDHFLRMFGHGPHFDRMQHWAFEIVHALELADMADAARSADALIVA